MLKILNLGKKDIDNELKAILGYYNLEKDYSKMFFVLNY